MTTHTRTSRTIGRLAAAAVLGASVAAGVGCRGDRSDAPPRQFFPDMDDQPKWKPQSASEFYVDSRTMRQPVEGAVPFGYSYVVSDAAWAAPINQARASLADLDPAFSEGRGEDGQYLERIPVPVTREMIARGQERFNIYCTPCHGPHGDGKGEVGVRFAAPPANLTDPRLMDRSQETGRDGYLFHVIRYGMVTEVEGQPDLIRMPPYAHALDEHDSWAVVAYVRALQEAQSASIEDVPEAQRQILSQSRPPAPEPAAGEAAPPAEGSQPEQTGGQP